MARATSTKHQVGFINGVVDTGNAFNAPENALRDASNVLVDRQGVLVTRNGLGPAVGSSWDYTSTSVTAQPSFTGVWEWDGATTSQGQVADIVMVGVNSAVNLFNKSDLSGQPPINDRWLDEVVLAPIPTGGLSKLMFSASAGHAFSTSAGTYPMVYTYLGVLGVDAVQFTPRKRDLVGVDEPYATDYRPLPDRLYASGDTLGMVNLTAGDTIVGNTSGAVAVALTDYPIIGRSPETIEILLLRSATQFVNGETVRLQASGDDVLSINTTGTSDGLTDDHYYNLINQGWTWPYISHYTVVTKRIPSNAQIWTAGRNSDGAFDPVALDKLSFGNTRAPTGHNIMDILSQTRTIEDPFSGQIVTLTAEDMKGGFAATTLFAGRLVLAGGTDQRLTDTVFISQDMTNAVMVPGDDAAFFEKFHSINDLTAEYINDTLPTDGVELVISGATGIHAVAPLGGALAVFADNGVWAISGSGLDVGFTAQSVRVVQISTIGSAGAGTVVPTDTSVLYMTATDIMSLSVDSVGTPSATSLTRGKLDGYVEGIPDKNRVTGNYDKAGQKILWFHNNPEDVPALPQYNKLRVLSLDLLSGALFPLDYSVGAVIGGNFYHSLIGTVDNAGVLTHAVMKYDNYVVDLTFVVETEGLTYDWDVSDGEEFSAWAETWPDHLGQPILEKQLDALSCFFTRTEKMWVDDGAGQPTMDYPSGCLVTVKYNWASEQGSKWFGPTSVYSLRDGNISDGIGTKVKAGEEVVRTSVKPRGAGVAFSILFSKRPGKVFKLLGYTLSISSNGER